RVLAIKPAPGLPGSPLLREYRDALARLEKKAHPSADDLADLGALHVRLGQLDKAIEVLRPAARTHPKHFAITANLGTALHLRGDLTLAASALSEAILLAPEKLRPIEKLHLKLVRARLDRKNAPQLDDLFGVTYGSEVGSMPADERKK